MFLTISTGGQTVVSPTLLRFDAFTWSTPQTVTVTAVEDVLVEGPHSGLISHAAASADQMYAGLPIASVTANIAADDAVDLQISKAVIAPSTGSGQAGGGMVASGAPITYTLAFTNAGSGLATWVILTDTVPATVTDVSFQSSLPVIPTGALSYTWQLPDLAPGAGGVITLSGKISADLRLVGTIFTNTATIASTAIDGNTLDSTSDSVLVTVTDPPQATLYVVNTTDDTDDGICGAVHCSLREALHAANVAPNGATPDEIRFNLTGSSGPYTLALTSALAAVVDPVILDGCTQPGADCAVSPPTLDVILDGSGAGASADGLQLAAGGSTVRGLVITGFDRDGVRVVTGTPNLITTNGIYANGGLGIDLAGDGVTPNDNNLGNVALDEGDYDAARERLEEAVALQRQVGDKWYIANSLNNLANVVCARGDYRMARALYNESLTINRELGDRRALAYLFEDTGCLAASQGQLQRALCLVGAAAALREAISAPVSPAEQNKLECRLEPARRELDEAGQVLAMDEGRAMSLDQAIDYVLSDDATG